MTSFWRSLPLIAALAAGVGDATAAGRRTQKETAPPSFYCRRLHATPMTTIRWRKGSRPQGFTFCGRNLVASAAALAP